MQRSDPVQRPSGPVQARSLPARKEIPGVVKSPPVSIAIPAIGVSSRLGPARGLKPNGTVDDAPLSGPIWSLPWWYDRGPSPGQDGSSVILGHVDSALGAGYYGVFFRLGSLGRGQRIVVTLADGVHTHWVTVSSAVYSDTAFPDSVVYAPGGPPVLRLVTCGGAYTWATHLYEAAVVVAARFVSAS